MRKLRIEKHSMLNRLRLQGSSQVTFIKVGIIPQHRKKKEGKGNWKSNTQNKKMKGTIKLKE